MHNAIADLERKLDTYIGQSCSGIVLCGMTNCGEQFTPPGTAGYHETTWGIILNFAGRDPLIVTWGEDKQIGDPFFIQVSPGDKFMRMSSLELQDVSAFPPWNQFVGTQLNSASVLAYQTNYPGDDLNAWMPSERRLMPWAVELRFSDRRLLVGALHHGDFLEYAICADEVVIAYDPELIEQIKTRRQDLKSEFQTIQLRGWQTWFFRLRAKIDDLLGGR